MIVYVMKRTLLAWKPVHVTIRNVGRVRLFRRGQRYPSHLWSKPSMGIDVNCTQWREFYRGLPGSSKKCVFAVNCGSKRHKEVMRPIPLTSKAFQHSAFRH